MRLTFSAAFFTLIAAAVAVLTKRATCSKCRTAAAASCCVWFDVLDDIQLKLYSIISLFISWANPPISRSMEENVERKFISGLGVVANNGIETFRTHAQGLFRRLVKDLTQTYPSIQFSGAVGVSNCLGAPRLEFLAGHLNFSLPSPPGLVQDLFDPVDKIVARFGNAGFSRNEIIDLLGPLTLSSLSRPFLPEVSSPEMEATRVKCFPHSLGEFRLQLGFAIARDPRIACEWQSFVAGYSRSNSQTPYQLLQSLLFDPDVIPAPKPLTKPFLLAGKTLKDIDVSWKASPFPILTAQPVRRREFRDVDSHPVVVSGMNKSTKKGNA
ncbi:hypothetical protein B0H10DRAFT_1937616 [Mycena sp. CBHHK59/15]|nr:hypothetical protein B0H10DRAFT_1937616 [Mycena sp. CBHHK59/15]